MSHSDKIKDCDAFFEVNPITRQIINKTPNKIVLMQNDHNSERFTFSLPRYIEGHDMAESAKAYLHYENPTKQDSGGSYEMKDLQIDPDDAEKVICSWLISANATKEPGALSFLIEFECYEGDVLVYSWHTLPHTGISVGATFNFKEEVATKYADVLHQWEQRLFGGGDATIDEDFLAKETVSPKNLLNPNSPDWLVGYKCSTSGVISEDSSRILSNFVEVTPGDNLIYSFAYNGRRQTINGKQWIYYYDADKNYVTYETNLSNSYFTVPEGVKYLRYAIIGYALFTDYQLEKNTEMTEYEAYFEPYEITVIRSDKLDKPMPTKTSELENDSSFISKVSKPVALPSILYGFVGVPISLYHYNIMDYSPSDVYIRMYTDAIGKLLKRKWEYTPDTAKTISVKYDIFNHNYEVLNNRETFSLVIKDTTIKSSLKVLVIGDSTVNQHHETQKMLDLATADGYDLTLLGTRGNTETNQHEGRGGWTAEMYVNNASNPSGSVVNAFYNPNAEKFDFSYYMAQQGYSGVDCVVIQLGINDMFSAKTDDELLTSQETFYTNLDYMIQSIHAYDSNIKIVINTIIPCDTDQDKFGNTYEMRQTVWRNHHNVYLTNRKTTERYANTNNVLVSWYCAMLDCDNNMDGGVHPTQQGYDELGTQMYGFIRATN